MTRMFLYATASTFFRIRASCTSAMLFLYMLLLLSGRDVANFAVRDGWMSIPSFGLATNDVTFVDQVQCPSIRTWSSALNMCRGLGVSGCPCSGANYEKRGKNFEL